MDNYTGKKLCSICQEYKDLTGEHWNFRSVGGTTPYCKVCSNAKRREERARYRLQEKTVPEYKVCPTCKNSKHNSEWPRNRSNKDGLHDYCKDCISVQNKNKLDRKIVNENKKRERSIAKARYSQYVYGFVYLIRLNEYTKIGISVNPKTRLINLDGASPYEYTLIHLIETDNMQRLEETLHTKYKCKHHKKEWFLLSDDDIQEIIDMGQKVIYGE